MCFLYVVCCMLCGTVLRKAAAPREEQAGSCGSRWSARLPDALLLRTAAASGCRRPDRRRPQEDRLLAQHLTVWLSDWHFALDTSHLHHTPSALHTLRCNLFFLFILSLLPCTLSSLIQIIQIPKFNFFDFLIMNCIHRLSLWYSLWIPSVFLIHF